ncbi:MAG: hypothetical protein CMK07_02430 [Ponticaulis sp.]|nr:hypothetical protein [Ponticaulis sp.]
MALLHYYTTDSIGAGRRILPVSGDTYIITEGVTIGSTTSGAIAETFSTSTTVVLELHIDGSVFGVYNTINSYNSLGRLEATLNIGTTGSVTSYGSDAIAYGGSTSTGSGEVIITNAGTVHGAAEGINAYHLNTFSLFNSGNISSGGDFSSSVAIFTSAEATDITNTGEIWAAAGGHAAIQSEHDLGYTGFTFELQNSGIISHTDIAIETDRRVDIINNSGQIFGNVLLNIGEDETLAFADTFTNSGSVFGDVSLGYGNDRFLGETGEVHGTIYGGDGDDLIRSGAADDTISGGHDDDTIKSGDGDDFILGGYGADEMWGGSGVDTASYELSVDGVRVSLNAGRGWFGEAQGDALYEIENLIGSRRQDTLIGNSEINELHGHGADDILNGLGGNDLLFGGNGDDNINGSAGNDYISGDRHQDRLTGGTGEDVFAFLDILDSGPAQSERDNITDFTQGQDLIDLTALGDLFFGGTAFSGAAGEIIYYHVAGGTRTVVEIDTDGDSNADFGILLSNAAHTMTAADFLFV